MSQAPESVAVLDANVVIGLAKADCLELLPRVFASVCIPPSVIAEVRDAHSRRALRAALSSWLTERSPDPPPGEDLGKAVPDPPDRDALALAIRLGGAILLTSDVQLENHARSRGIAHRGTARLIQVFVQRGLLPAARPVFELLRQRGFGIAPDAQAEILRELGE